MRCGPDTRALASSTGSRAMLRGRGSWSSVSTSREPLPCWILFAIPCRSPCGWQRERLEPEPEWERLSRGGYRGDWRALTNRPVAFASFGTAHEDEESRSRKGADE